MLVCVGGVHVGGTAVVTACASKLALQDRQIDAMSVTAQTWHGAITVNSDHGGGCIAGLSPYQYAAVSPGHGCATYGFSGGFS